MTKGFKKNWGFCNVDIDMQLFRCYRTPFSMLILLIKLSVIDTVMQLSPQFSFRTVPSSPKMILWPFTNNPCLCPGLRQPLIAFPLQFCFFYRFHISRIIQYVVFSVWHISFSVMFLKFISVIASISSSFYCWELFCCVCFH